MSYWHFYSTKWRVQYGGWFVLCRFFSREITPGKKIKRRHAKRRNNETTPCEKTKSRNNTTWKDEKRHAKRRQIDSYKRRIFAWRLFVLEFRLFVWRVTLFRLFAWRYFVYSHGLISSFRFFGWLYFGAKRRNGTNQPPKFRAITSPQGNSKRCQLGISSEV